MNKTVQSIKEGILQRLVQLPGWHSSRRIIVIESDDWGMQRMASQQAYAELMQQGYKPHECHYNRNDSLESNADLTALMETLNEVKDTKGRPAKMTINNVVANPDFQKIKDSKFKSYFFQPFPETLKEFSGRDQVMDLYAEGIQKDLFQPQFHGREHLGAGRWLNALQTGVPKFRDAFNYKMFAVHDQTPSSSSRELLNAFAPEGELMAEDIVARIKGGLKLFESIWGFSSKSIIAPCYHWNSDLEESLISMGIKYWQGGRAQVIPGNPGEPKKALYHWTGQKGSKGQIYLIRNVHFEPAERENKDHVQSALKQIHLAFKYRKPAIISTHRVNFIGSLRPENRDRGLLQFRNLLKAISQKWPDAEFMSSDELGDLIQGQPKH